MVLALTLVLAACGSKPEAEGDKPAAEQGQTATEGTTNEEGLVTEGVIAAADPSLNPEAALARTDTMIIGTTDPSGIFNPLFAESAYDMYITESIFASLLRPQKDGSYESWLADMSVSDDNKTFTFVIKDGAKFSDGTPVTAEDVAFTITMLYDKDYDGPTDVMQYAPLVGAQEYKDGTATSIAGIKVVDEKTVEFTTTDVKVLATSVFGTTGIMPKHIFGDAYKQGNLGGIRDAFTKPVGAGPYVLTEYHAGQEVRLVANENYIDGTPAIKNMIFKTTTEETAMQLVQTGETDFQDGTVSKDQVEEIESFGFADQVLNPTNGYGYIAFNNNDPKYADPSYSKVMRT